MGTDGMAEAREQALGIFADALLKLAKIAAHASGERSNAPLLCYLVGRIQGERGLDEILDQVRRSSS